MFFDSMIWADYTVFFDEKGNARAYTSKYAVKAQDACDQLQNEPNFEWEDFSTPIELGPYAKYGFDWELAEAGFSSFEQRLLELEHEYAP